MSDAPEINRDYLDMVREFIRAEVRFVIVGAYALAVHGIPRTTGDIDILVEPNEENATRVIEALRAFGAPIAAHGVDATAFSVAGNVYQVGLVPRRIDILTSVSGIDFEEAYKGATPGKFGEYVVRYLGVDAMIKNKRAAGRDKDLIDAKNLEKRKK